MTQSIKGIHFKTQKPVSFSIEKNRILDISENESNTDLLWIAPGLVDLQVNGFKGKDFNEETLQVEDVKEITRELWSIGVTTYFPTLITNSEEKIGLAIQKIIKACEDKSIDDTIEGIHLEGPFLSMEDGPRGAHPIAYIKAPDWDLFCRWQTIAKGKIKMITLSPEWPESVFFIKKCVESGVKVAIGHTSCSPSQISEAVNAGATLSTHLGNAAHAFLPRHSNYLWEQLASDNLWTTMIADGFHLPKALLKVFLKVKPKKSILVSDATKFAGMKPGIYQSHIGGAVALDENGRLSMRDSPGFLAGSAKSLLDCIDHLTSNQILSHDNAIEMASIKPMEAMEIRTDYGLEIGSRADLIIYELDEGKIKIIQTIKSGKVVCSNL
ncbi:amidohydrolase family protein [Belliella sp. R4-6]|uniref:Amidohydrolase family protein n=1 Tax=Belliella alkalica TaxID=1730871 RepID=A0ABS9V6P3_9BACT|nr:amidohydrolase family protein [Belliella alkalica]MCH7412091.1 amidohydrolase family protein [Belliella alkalica]